MILKFELKEFIDIDTQKVLRKVTNQEQELLDKYFSKEYNSTHHVYEGNRIYLKSKDGDSYCKYYTTIEILNRLYENEE